MSSIFQKSIKSPKNLQIHESLLFERKHSKSCTCNQQSSSYLLQDLGAEEMPPLELTPINKHEQFYKDFENQSESDEPVAQYFY